MSTHGEPPNGCEPVEQRARGSTCRRHTGAPRAVTGRVAWRRGWITATTTDWSGLVRRRSGSSRCAPRGNRKGALVRQRPRGVPTARLAGRSRRAGDRPSVQSCGGGSEHGDAGRRRACPFSRRGSPGRPASVCVVRSSAAVPPASRRTASKAISDRQVGSPARRSRSVCRCRSAEDTWTLTVSLGRDARRIAPRASRGARSRPTTRLSASGWDTGSHPCGHSSTGLDPAGGLVSPVAPTPQQSGAEPFVEPVDFRTTGSRPASAAPVPSVRPPERPADRWGSAAQAARDSASASPRDNASSRGTPDSRPHSARVRTAIGRPSTSPCASRAAAIRRPPRGPLGDQRVEGAVAVRDAVLQQRIRHPPREVGIDPMVPARPVRQGQVRWSPPAHEAEPRTRPRPPRRHDSTWIRRVGEPAAADVETSSGQRFRRWWRPRTRSARCRRRRGRPRRPGVGEEVLRHERRREFRGNIAVRPTAIAPPCDTIATVPGEHPRGRSGARVIRSTMWAGLRPLEAVVEVVVQPPALEDGDPIGPTSSLEPPRGRRRNPRYRAT